MSKKLPYLTMTSLDYKVLVSRYGLGHDFFRILNDFVFAYFTSGFNDAPYLWDLEDKPLEIAVRPGQNKNEVYGYLTSRNSVVPKFKSLRKIRDSLVHIPITAPKQKNSNTLMNEAPDVPGSNCRRPYHLECLIEETSYSQKFKGFYISETHTNQLCCITRINQSFAVGSHILDSYINMSKIAKYLDHPNIIRILDFYHEPASTEMVTEYTEGFDLASLINTFAHQYRRLPVPIVLYIAAEVARGLHFMHTAIDKNTNTKLQVLHCGICPQNIFIGTNGRVLIKDLTLVRSTLTPPVFSPGVVYGFLAYMSPEAITGNDLDSRSDIFSLGSVLWEMLTMQPLFEEMDPGDLSLQVERCKIQYDLVRCNPLVDDRLLSILRRALAKDTAHRYDTAEDFECELRNYIRDKFAFFDPKDLEMLFSFEEIVVARKQEKMFMTYLKIQ